MELSIEIARVMGPTLVLVSLGVLLNVGRYQQMTEDFFKNQSLIFFSSISALVVGLMLVMNHNYWVGSWEVIVTIVSWIILVKGAFAVVFPEQVVELAKSMRQKNMIAFWAVVNLIVGGSLIYVSYIVV